MIDIKKFYACRCDACNRLSEDPWDENTHWDNKPYARKVAKDKGYVFIKGKVDECYCQKCGEVVWDEERDVRTVFVGGRMVGLAEDNI